MSAWIVRPKNSNRIPSYTDEKIGDLAAMVQRGFNELERKFDVRKEVDELKRQMKQVREAVGL